MQDDAFEWSDRKAAANLKNHSVSFELAKKVFSDPLATERLDDRENYGEDRFVLVGLAGEFVLYVIYTVRGGRFRLISARKATRREQHDYFKKRG